MKNNSEGFSHWQKCFGFSPEGPWQVSGYIKWLYLVIFG